SNPASCAFPGAHRFYRKPLEPRLSAFAFLTIHTEKTMGEQPNEPKPSSLRKCSHSVYKPSWARDSEPNPVCDLCQFSIGSVKAPEPSPEFTPKIVEEVVLETKSRIRFG